MTARTHRHHHVHWFFWPIKALWTLIASIIGFTGRFLAVTIGLVLIVIGIVASLTVVGAIVGVPLALIGFLIVLRGIF